MKRITKIATMPSFTPPRREVPVFIIIRYENGRLSISGVEGPWPSGNCAGACGQIDMHEWEDYTPAKGIDLARIRAIWERWYLNDMRAGSPAQEQYLRDNPMTVTYPESHYDKAVEVLTAVGLHPDPNHDNYKYGSAWLSEPVPQEVIDYLFSLPDDSDLLHHSWH